MRLLDRYICREVASHALLGLAVFSFGFSALTAVVTLFAFAALLLFVPCFGAAGHRQVEA